MKRVILFLLKEAEDPPDLRSEMAGFEVRHVFDPDQALQALNRGDIKAVITDHLFQGNPERPFLSQVMQRFPKVIRIALCSPEPQKRIQSEFAVHQYLWKPCTAQTVAAALERSERLDGWLARLNRNELFQKWHMYPTLPPLYFRLARELDPPDADPENLGEIIAEDPVMSTQVVKVVNSPCFGLSRPMSSPMEAASFLGAERTKALALASHVFQQFGPAIDADLSLEKLWRHSMRTGMLAQTIAEEETGDVRLAEDAFAAGLLHDIGKLLIGENLPSEFNRSLLRARQQRIPFYEAEWDVLDATHAEVGAAILGTWGLPDRIVDAIAYQHAPAQCPDTRFHPLTALHMANTLEHESSDETEQTLPQKVDLEYLSCFQMAQRMDFWREMVCGE